jgi:hypothetical protein
MIAAHEEREGHMVIVVEGGRRQAKTRRRLPAAFRSRVGLHTPDSTNLDGCAVEASGADEETHV